MPPCGRCATPILCAAVAAGWLRYMRARGCIMSMSAAAATQWGGGGGGGGGGPFRPRPFAPSAILIWLVFFLFVCWATCTKKTPCRPTGNVDSPSPPPRSTLAHGSMDAAQKNKKKKKEEFLSCGRVADAPHPSYALPWTRDGYAACARAGVSCP